MQKELNFIKLFGQFVRDSDRGKRLKPDGQKIRPQTVRNYASVLKLLEDFERSRNYGLRIKAVNRLTARQQTIEKNYWKKFYRQFSEYLYKERGCFDNTAGSVFKVIKAFFNYLNKDREINTGDLQKNFYIRKEDIPVITLTPAQLQFLISNEGFEHSLRPAMRRTRDLFVFGCTVALRYSDLCNIRLRDIERVEGSYYLCARSVKTDTVTKVKLPAYAVDIIKRHSKSRSGNKAVFTPISVNQLNRNIRALAEMAGWTDIVGKRRRRDGKDVEVQTSGDNKTYRFCDLLSSHTMRRTAVTTMLMLGMPEHVVRKISGHSVNSKAFFRYVNFVQSYLDNEIDKVHERLMVA